MFTTTIIDPELNDADAYLAFNSTALFDQYDDAPPAEAANDDWYENLYPSLA